METTTRTVQRKGDVMSCCCIDVDECSTLLDQRWRKARKEHQCIECCRTIMPGVKYFFEKTVFEGELKEYKTCALCLNVRNDRFPCGFYYGDLWSELWECLNEGDEDDEWLAPPTGKVEL